MTERLYRLVLTVSMFVHNLSARGVHWSGRKLRLLDA